MIWILIYMVLGYWATGETICKNKVYIEFKFGALFLHRLMYGTILGWILIPTAIIKKLYQGGVPASKIFGGIVVIVAILMLLISIFGKDSSKENNDVKKNGEIVTNNANGTTNNANGINNSREGTYKSTDGRYVVIDLLQDYGDGLYTGYFAESGTPWVRTEVVIDIEEQKIAYKVIDNIFTYKLDNKGQLTFSVVDSSYSKISNECEYDKVLDKSKMSIKDIVGGYESAIAYHVLIEYSDKPNYVNVKIVSGLGLVQGETKYVHYEEFFNNNGVKIAIDGNEYNVFFAGQMVIGCDAYFDGFVKKAIFEEPTTSENTTENKQDEVNAEKSEESLIDVIDQETEETTKEGNYDVTSETTDSNLLWIKLENNELKITAGSEFEVMSIVEDYGDYGEVNVSGEYNIYSPGKYEIEYYVQDKEGNVSNIEKFCLIVEEDKTVDDQWITENNLFINRETEISFLFDEWQENMFKVEFYGLGYDMDWKISKNPDEIGVNGEWIYMYEGHVLTYNPYKHYVIIESSDEMISGKYDLDWFDEFDYYLNTWTYKELNFSDIDETSFQICIWERYGRDRCCWNVMYEISEESTKREIIHYGEDGLILKYYPDIKSVYINVPDEEYAGWYRY